MPDCQTAFEVAPLEHHCKGLTGHLCSVTYREAAELGIDQLEHGFSPSTDFVTGKKENDCPASQATNASLARLNVESDAVKSLFQLLIGKKVILTSTLQVREGSTTLQPVPDPMVLEAMAPDTRDYYLKRLIGRFAIQAPTTADSSFKNLARMEKLFSDAGGLLTVGTDPTGNGGVLAGYGNWRNIELLVSAAGFSPVEAIKIATLNGAIALGIDKIAGTIQTGKEADLIIVDGDPSTRIADIRKVVWVFKDGTGFSARKLFESVKGKVGFH
jgi:imidazolonepropionase-like amidohydrolase